MVIICQEIKMTEPQKKERLPRARRENKFDKENSLDNHSLIR
jgi:hypothetical protein